MGGGKNTVVDRQNPVSVPLGILPSVLSVGSLRLLRVAVYVQLISLTVPVY